MTWRRALILHGLRRGVWRARRPPADCDGVPTMLVPDELKLLDFLAERWWSGEGAIVDAGAFLGGSTMALAGGASRNRALPQRRMARPIQSYDLFQVEDWTRGIYFGEEVAAGADTRALFDANTAPHADLIEVHQGDITRSTPPAAPIEILFIDVAKHWTVCDWITETLFPRLVPGRSIVVQQDYLYHYWNAWLHVTMEYYHRQFERLCDTGVNSVAFLLKKPFQPGDIRPGLVASLTLAEKSELMDRAAARFHGQQREWLRSAKVHFIEMLNDAGQSA